MDDSQSPPDAENRKGDSARRAGLRLRDTEVVAASRRDMLGDGSLLDALGDRPLPQGQSLAADTAASAEPAQPPNPDEAAEERPQMHAAVAPDPADPVAPAAAPESVPAQSLDAIIDSFPADSPPQTSDQALPEPQADASFLAASRFALLERSSDAAGIASDQVPAAGPERFQVSSIFEGLGSPAPRGVEDSVDANGHDAPGGSALTDARASEPASGPAPGDMEDGTVARQPTPATLGLRVPLYYQPQAAPPMPPPSDWPPMDAPTADGDAGPRFGDTEWPPLPVSDTDGSASTEAADRAQAAATEPAPFPEPLGWPPFPERPGSPAADSGVAPLEPPSLVGSRSSTSPFPAPPAWPPFPESPGADAGLSAAEPSGMPPYIELPAHPESAEDQAAPSEPNFAEPPPPGAAPTYGLPPDPFAEASASTDAPPFAGRRGLPAFTDRPAATALPEPEDLPRFRDLERDQPALDTAGARTSTRATAKIAAEANATAQALDNLQRLLNKTVAPAPLPQPARPQAPPQRPYNAHLHLPKDDPFAHEMAPMLPLPMPPPMTPPPERGIDRSVYLLGFFTGLVLSVMAGAALYFLINAG